MDLGLQAKFLRTLETGKIRPVGSTQEEIVDVRIICATHRNLSTMVDEGRFRQDLFFRINQFTFVLPPIRDRENDKLLLARYFLEKYRAEYPDKAIIDFSGETLKYIMSYQWPGNIRELKSAVHRAVILSRDSYAVIDALEELPSSQSMDFEVATRNFQNELIVKVLAMTAGNRDQAAQLLGIPRSTFFRYQSSVKPE